MNKPTFDTMNSTVTLASFIEIGGRGKLCTCIHYQRYHAIMHYASGVPLASLNFQLKF